MKKIITLENKCYRVNTEIRHHDYINLTCKNIFVKDAVTGDCPFFISIAPDRISGIIEPNFSITSAYRFIAFYTGSKNVSISLRPSCSGNGELWFCVNR